MNLPRDMTIGVDTDADTQTSQYNIFKQYRKQLDLLASRSKIKFNFDTNIEIFMDIFQNHNLSNESNCPTRSNILGVYYCYIEKDYEMAKVHWFMACDQSNSDAMKNLGNYYLYIEHNDKQGLNFYSMACEKANVEAMYNLGCYFLHRTNNIYKAIEYFTMGAENGCVDSMFNLAQCYYIRGNYGKAQLYYEMAHEKNHLRAPGCLGQLYYEVKKDLVLALKYYLIAFENGDYRFYDNLMLVVMETNSKEILVRIVKKLLTDGELTMVKNINMSDLEKWKMLYLLEKDGFTNGTLVCLRSELENNRDIMCLKNKMLRATKFNTLEQCLICLDDNVLCVEMNCGHSVCFNCWDPSLKCYYKWCECLS